MVARSGLAGNARQRRGGRGPQPDSREGRDGLGGGRREPDGGEAAPRLERLHEIVGALKPLVGGLRHHLLGDLEHRALVIGLERRGGDFLHDVFVADRERVLAVERHAADEALIGDHAERIDVGAPIEPLGARLLRAHVMRRADGHSGARELAARRRLRDSEIRDHRQPVLVEHDVVGLDVAVHDAALVRVREGARHLDEDLTDLARGERAARGQHGRQWLAAQKLHDEIDHPAGFADAVNRDDAGVLELGGRTGLALEPLDELLVEREGERQDLDGDFAIELGFLGLEDDRHPAAAQLVEDFVLLFELLAHHLDFRQLLLLLDGADRSRRRQIEAAGVAELRAILILGAAAGAIQSDLRGSRGNLGLRRSGCQPTSAPRLGSVASAWRSRRSPDRKSRR